VNESLRLFQECAELLRSEIGAKASSEATGGNLEFAIDPVAVPMVEQPGMASRQRADQDVLCSGELKQVEVFGYDFQKHVYLYWGFNGQSVSTYVAPTYEVLSENLSMPR
jgi:hypothetical protein